MKMKIEGLRENEPMAAHTSFRCGGAARGYVEPKDIAAFADCLRELHKQQAPYFLLGAGTNVLVRDEGYGGIVVSTKNIPAGQSLAKIARDAQEQGRTGLEPLSGIPGTLGGAIRMNAGAYDAEIGALIKTVDVYDAEKDEQRTLTPEECEFSYRSSIFVRKKLAILDAELVLKEDAPESILNRMRDFSARRAEKQPIDLPSAGSFFKRPKGDFAARLIDEAGLKGFSAGGAAVSEKHAGFIVNNGGATASDVLAVAAHIQGVVADKFGIILEIEPVVL